MAIIFYMRIIDAHVHLWDTRMLIYPWLKDIPLLNHPFLLDDYRQAARGVPVDGIVFVQAEVEPTQALEEARWVSGIAGQEMLIRGIIPWAPLEKGAEARPFLQELLQLPLVKGIRRIIQFEPDPGFCLRPQFVQGVQLLAEFGWSFDICISHGQLENATTLVRKCPEVTFVLDHVAKPDIRRRLWEPWAANLRKLADLPNVFCKISGMVTEDDHAAWQPENLKPYAEHAIACFGFDRVIFGGDWPVVTRAADYTTWFRALESIIEGSSLEEQRKLYRDNAVRAYRL